MCSKSSSSSPISGKKRAKSTKKSATKDSRRLSTKTRTRTRKPKYLSLKLELFPSQQQKQQQQKKKKTKTKTPQKLSSKTMSETTKQQQQLNLFPLHPENMVLDLNDDHQQVAFLLETATDSSTSLQSLLDISSNTTSTTTTTTTAATTTTSEDDPLSLYRGQQDRSEEVDCGGGPSLLIRTAMRCKERDASEERWVSYCEVVKKEAEEVSSDRDYKINSLEFNINPAAADEEQGKKMGLVGLKLDYEEILSAWSDKGSLFIEGESPQTVPDLQDIVSLDNGLGSMMRVPEMGGMKMERGQREASVLRYKEKRHSRLFSKRIRYEVRKLNAEKRPRLKGRFVKRSGEE